MCIAAAIGGAALVGAGASIYGANKAAKTQGKAAGQANAEQRYEYDQTRADQAPFLKLGRFGVNNLLHAKDRFETSPGYQFRLNEGQRDIGNSFAARGGAFGGNALRALTDYNQQSASGEFGNWWNQQAGLVGGGQNSANTLASAGQNTANQISSNYLGAGDARASGIIGATNGVSNALSSGVNNWLYYRPGSGSGSSSSSSRGFG